MNQWESLAMFGLAAFELRLKASWSDHRRLFHCPAESLLEVQLKM